MKYPFVLLLFILSLLFFSCQTTVPSIEETSGTLLIIPVEKYIEPGLQYNTGAWISFNIELNDVDAPLRVSIKDPYTFIGHLDAGSYSSRSIQQIITLKSGFVGNTETSPVPLMTFFKLEEGGLTIFPYRIRYALVSTPTGGYSQGWEMEELEKRDIDRILKELETQENFHQWTVNP